VNLVYSGINLNTRCSIDTFKFPFDKQVCAIQIGSWTMSSNQFDFKLTDSQIYMNDFNPNAVWDLTKYDTSTTIILDRFYHVYSDYTMQSANLNLYLSRKPLYYVINLILPSLVLNVANLVLLALPNGKLKKKNWFLSLYINFNIFFYLKSISIYNCSFSFHNNQFERCDSCVESARTIALFARSFLLLFALNNISNHFVCLVCWRKRDHNEQVLAVTSCKILWAPAPNFQKKEFRPLG
jgi:hypothetical protein